MIASMFSFWTLCMYINIESLVNMFSMYFFCTLVCPSVVLVVPYPWEKHDKTSVE